MNYFKKILPLFIIILFLSACNGKIPGADARKIPYDPNERVKRNLEQGKGFRIDDFIYVIKTLNKYFKIN